ncbi:hypothetical protein LINGRAHAP2_LOCUS14699 [Linum grandiflorum]
MQQLRNVGKDWSLWEVLLLGWFLMLSLTIQTS